MRRSLLIGVTDLELGLGRPWNLTREAGEMSVALARDRVREVILASTALPAALPPVEIDGRNPSAT